MDGTYKHDLDLVLRHVTKAEIFAIFFPHIRKSLVVDMRVRGDDAPFIRVLPMARSAAERIRTIKRLRPHLPRPQQITTVPWMAYVRNFVSAGVWAKIEGRFVESGSAKGLGDAHDAIEQLLQAERQEMSALIRGEEYETIWSRS